MRELADRDGQSWRCRLLPGGSTETSAAAAPCICAGSPGAPHIGFFPSAGLAREVLGVLCVVLPLSEARASGRWNLGTSIVFESV